MSKIFCKDCEYYRKEEFDAFSLYPHQCNHPNNLGWKNDPDRSYLIYIKKLEEINKNNNCKWFQLRVPFYKKIYRFLIGKKIDHEISNTQKTELSPDELLVIKRFAVKYDHIIKEEALKIFYKHLNNPHIRYSDAMRYMSEVDNIVPDGCLKNIYKNRLLSK